MDTTENATSGLKKHAITRKPGAVVVYYVLNSFVTVTDRSEHVQQISIAELHK